MKTTNSVAFFLLAFAVLGEILPVGSKSKIMCESGTGLRKIRGVAVCEPCPNGTFSKGNNSLCRSCRTCYQNRVKKACSATHNTVCKRKKVCKGLWQKKKIHHLMKYCSGSDTDSSHRRKKNKCRGQSGKCDSRDSAETTPTTQLSALRYPSSMRPRAHRKKTRQKNVKPTENDEDYLQSETLKNASLRTSRRPRSTHNITTSTPPWNIVVNTTADRDTNFQESEGHEPLDINAVIFVFISGVVLLVIMAIIIVIFARRKRRKSRNQEPTFLTLYSQKDHERILDSSVMFDKAKNISRVEIEEKPGFPKYVNKHTHIYRKSSNRGIYQWNIVPSSNMSVNQNEYFHFPCVGADGHIESRRLFPNETSRRNQAFSVSSGCSDLSRLGQRIDSDRDSFNFSDDSPSEECEISYMQDSSLTRFPHNTSPDSKKCAGMGDGRDENGSKMKPLISLDTVPPTCREATLKPRVSCYTDVQRLVLQSLDAKRRESQGRSYFPEADNAQGRHSSITTKDAANVENSDENSCKDINKNTEQKNATHLELENDNLFVTTFGDILGESPDPRRMSASTSGSTSPYPSSDEMTSSSQGSTSSDTGPVTYTQIHNIYPVKDTNMTANTQSTTQASETEDSSAANQGDLGTSDIPEDREDTGFSSSRSDQGNEDKAIVTRSTLISRDPSNTTFERVNEKSYKKNTRCKPENLHETLYKTEGTQTRHNCENMLTIFGQKWDVTKYFSSNGGQLTKSTTNMSLTVFANCIPEGETVLVSGRFTGNSLDVLPYLDEGWVVISPLAEFQMTYRKRWDKLVKINLPYYPHHPKELLRVCYYHRTEKGDIEYGDVPSFDESKNQDMFYVKKPNHVEIYTVTFTLFHCACDHKFPLYLTSLVFTSYNKDENEAVVRVHIGDKLLGDQLVTKELEEKERREHGTTLKQSKDVRLLQCGEFDGDSRLVFKIDFPKNRSSVQDNTLVYPRTSGDSDANVWENLFPQECPQTQERRFCELVKCMCQCNPGGKQTTGTTCTSLRHHCREEIEWTYASTLLPTPCQFPCTISITHELPPGQEANRHDACQEGITWYRLKTPHGDLQPLAKESPRDEMLGLRDLPSYLTTKDDFCGLPYFQK